MHNNWYLDIFLVQDDNCYNNNNRVSIMKIRDGTQLANTDSNPGNTDAEVRIQDTIIMLSHIIMVY